MTRPSDSLDELTSDVYHLKTLIEVATEKAIDASNPDPATIDIANLLWIARDLIADIAANTEACHTKVLQERRGSRKEVAA